MDSQMEDNEWKNDLYIFKFLELFLSYRYNDEDKDNGHERLLYEYFEKFQKILTLDSIKLRLKGIKELYKEEAMKLIKAGRNKNESKLSWFPLAENLFSDIFNWEEEISRHRTSSSVPSDDSSLKTNNVVLENFASEPRNFPSLPSTHKLTSSQINMATSTGIPFSQSTPSHRIGNITSVSPQSQAGYPIRPCETKVHFPSAAPISRADQILKNYKPPPPIRMNVRYTDSHLVRVFITESSSLPRQSYPTAPLATRKKPTSSAVPLSKNTAITSAKSRPTSTVIPTVDGETSSSIAVSLIQLSPTILSTDDVPLSPIVTSCANRSNCSTTVTYSLIKGPIFTNSMCSKDRLPHVLHRPETPLSPVVSTPTTGIPLSQTTPSQRIGNTTSIFPLSRTGHPIRPQRSPSPSRTEVRFPSAVLRSRADQILKKYKPPPPYKTNDHLTSPAVSSSSSVLTPALQSSRSGVFNANAPSSSTSFLTSATPSSSTDIHTSVDPSSRIYILTSAALSSSTGDNTSFDPSSSTSDNTSSDLSSSTRDNTSAALSSRTSYNTSAISLSRAGHPLWPSKLPPPYRNDSDFTPPAVSSSSNVLALASPSSRSRVLKSTALPSSSILASAALSSSSILASAAPFSSTNFISLAAPSCSNILTSPTLSSSVVNFPSAVASSRPKVLKSTGASSSTSILTSATKSSSNNILTSVSPSSGISIFTSAAPPTKARYLPWKNKKSPPYRISVPLTSAAASYRSSVRSSVSSNSHAGDFKTTAPTSMAKLHISPDNSYSVFWEKVPLSPPVSPNLNGAPFFQNSSISGVPKSTVPCSNTNNRTYTSPLPDTSVFRSSAPFSKTEASFPQDALISTSGVPLSAITPPRTNECYLSPTASSSKIENFPLSPVSSSGPRLLTPISSSSNIEVASTISSTITSPSCSQSRNLNCDGSCYTLW